MQALVLRDDTEAAVLCAKALLNKGFQVVCVENRHIARALLRVDTFDLLVLDERITGRLTHSIALAAERRYPYINTVLLTDRTGPDVDELYDLIPCIYAIAGLDSSPELLGKLAMASIESFEQAEARVRHNLSRFVMDDAAIDAMIAEEEKTLEPLPGPPVPGVLPSLPEQAEPTPAIAQALPANPPQPIYAGANPIVLTGTVFHEDRGVSAARNMASPVTEPSVANPIEDTFEFSDVTANVELADPVDELADEKVQDSRVPDGLLRNGLAAPVISGAQN